ncbi:MAG: glycosyl transferase [Leptolyngbya sp.]|nr:MAG: glycosyl transferase [Leptolyngbya sp.]
MDFPQVSIIVPTFLDTDCLRLCLTALENQTYPKDKYEVIVVNNCVDDDLQPLLKKFKGVKLVTEPKPGSYAARNRGIAEAKANILAFTDADCIPAQDWLEQGVKNLIKTEDCGLVAGSIRVFVHNPSAPKACELYDKLFAFPQKNYLEVDHYGATANVFTYKAVFETVGLFDADMKSGGDYEWGQRVHAANYAMAYAETASIDHPARDSFYELCKKTRRIVDGHYILMRKNLFPKSRFFGGLLADLMLPFRSVPRILADPEIKAKGQRLQVIGISILLRYIKFYERLARLQVGG